MSLPMPLLTPASPTWASLIGSPITHISLRGRWKRALTAEAAASSTPANASIATAAAYSWNLLGADRQSGNNHFFDRGDRSFPWEQAKCWEALEHGIEVGSGDKVSARNLRLPGTAITPSSSDCETVRTNTLSNAAKEISI